jgi:hypothetical protein
MELKKKGEVKFKCSAHQLYNSLLSGVACNRSLAQSARIYGNDPTLAIQLDHQANYQESLLESLFKDGTPE